MSALSQALRRKLERCRGMHIELPVAELLKLVEDIERMELDLAELEHELGLGGECTELLYPDDET